MIDLKKAALITLLAVSFFLGATSQVAAQDRQRVVTTSSSRPLNQPIPPSSAPKPPTVTVQSSSRPIRPTLTNDIVVPPSAQPQPLVKKTAMASPAMAAIAAGRMVYDRGASSMIMNGIQSRLGIPYLYGSSGPNRYDCSGFVWSVFRDAGIDFTRASARSLWAASTPVEGNERYKFGTLVFLNNLGHMGIVADENGFYHASSSKGITYSPFKGYWEKRINGFRRLTVGATPTVE